MNTYHISLSSNSISSIQTLSELSFQDNTTLNVSISGISEALPPLYIKFSWGDGDEKLYLNDPIKKYTENNIFPEILMEKYSEIFAQRLSKVYIAPPSSLYTTLTASLSVVYPSNNTSIFTIPIKIRKNDYFENFGDVSLNNSRLMVKLKREYQFSAKIDNKIFENVTTD